MEKMKFNYKIKRMLLKFKSKKLASFSAISCLLIIGALFLNSSFSSADTAWVNSYALTKDNLIRDIEYGTAEYHKEDIKYVWDISENHDGSILAYYFKDDSNPDKYAGGTLMFYNTDPTNTTNYVMSMDGYLSKYYDESEKTYVIDVEKHDGSSKFQIEDFPNDSFYSNIVKFRGYNPSQYNNVTPWSVMNQLSESDRVHEVHFYNTLYFKEMKYLLSGFEDCFIDIKNLNFAYIENEVASLALDDHEYGDSYFGLDLKSYFEDNLSNLKNCTIKFTGNYGFMCFFVKWGYASAVKSKNLILDLRDATFTRTNQENTYDDLYLSFWPDSVDKIYIPQELNNFNNVAKVGAFIETAQIYEVWNDNNSEDESDDIFLGYTYKMIDKRCSDYSKEPSYLVPRPELLWQALYLTFTDNAFLEDLKQLLVLGTGMSVSDIDEAIIARQLVSYAGYSVKCDLIEDAILYKPKYNFLEEPNQVLVRPDSGMGSEGADTVLGLLINELYNVHGSSGAPTSFSSSEFLMDAKSYITSKLGNIDDSDLVVTSSNSKENIDSKFLLIQTYANDYFKKIMMPELDVSKNDTVTYLDEMEIDIKNAKDSFFDKYYVGQRTSSEIVNAIFVDENLDKTLYDTKEEFEEGFLTLYGDEDLTKKLTKYTARYIDTDPDNYVFEYTFDSSINDDPNYSDYFHTNNIFLGTTLDDKDLVNFDVKYEIDFSNFSNDFGNIYILKEANGTGARFDVDDFTKEFRKTRHETGGNINLIMMGDNSRNVGMFAHMFEVLSGSVTFRIKIPKTVTRNDRKDISNEEEVDVRVLTADSGIVGLYNYKEVGDYIVFDNTDAYAYAYMFLTNAGDVDIDFYYLGAPLEIDGFSFIGDAPGDTRAEANGLTLNDFNTNEDVTSKLNKYKIHVYTLPSIYSSVFKDAKGMCEINIDEKADVGQFICAVPKVNGKSKVNKIVWSNNFKILADVAGEVTYEFQTAITKNTLDDTFYHASTTINVNKLDLSVNNNKVKIELLSDKADGDLDKVKVTAINNKNTKVVLEKDKDYEVTYDSAKNIYKVTGIGSCTGTRNSDELPKEDPAPTPGPGPSPSPDKPGPSGSIVSISTTTQTKKAINGYLDGTFKPNNPITRAEVCKILSVLNDYNENQNGTYIPLTKEFKDLIKEDWYSPYIGHLLKMGAVSGDGNKFRPNDYMTRAEVCKLLTSLYFIKDNGISVEKVSSELKGKWFDSCVTKLYKSGYLKGYPDGEIKPNSNITRAEFITLINRVLNKNKSNTETFGTDVKFTDVKRTDWFYNDLLVALCY